MKIAPFATEHFFAEYEFTTPYQLCNSDCETVTIAELLAMAEVDLAELGQVSLGYTESQGNPQLRRALATSYATASPDDIVVLGTPVEGIYLAARALLEPDDEVIVLSPAYDALINMFEHVVGTSNVKKWQFQSTATGWKLDFDALAQKITSKTKLLVVNFPHNPTGYLPTPDQLTQLVQIVEQHNLWLFYDEMYHGLIHSGTPPIPSAADVCQRAVVLSGLSKTYGLPGLRTGWLVIQDEAPRQNVMNWKFYTSICPPAPSEFLALAAWQVREQLRQKNIAQIEQNLALAEQFFERWPDLFGWKRPHAGSVALVKMNVPSVTQFATRMAAEAGVLIHPATTLGSDDHHMRMGFGRAAFATALTQFENYLQQNRIPLT
ncbi:pyridoxal phosphate-dependent aminotransferase [Candidatus Leptofilum sp.]|uniref:pyridoxal phosphate-dependent aminotransferase n=1 Tax=Candidatus Leptofilum sp. TaxID=3241576 RepID=UPI003B59AE36